MSIFCCCFVEIKRFCCCMRLKTGVRVLTGLSLLIGELYLVMGVALFDDSFPFFINASAVSYHILGCLLHFWFLCLLVFQSTKSRIPRLVLLKFTKVLVVWLTLEMVFLVVSQQLLLALVHFLHFSSVSVSNKIVFKKERGRHQAFEKKENFLLVSGILISALSFVLAFHSFYVVRNYISVLEDEEARRVDEHIKSSSFNSEVWDKASNVSSLLRKLFTNEEQGAKSVVTNVVYPTYADPTHSGSTNIDAVNKPHHSDSDSLKSEISNDFYCNVNRKATKSREFKPEEK